MSAEQVVSFGWVRWRTGEGAGKGSMAFSTEVRIWESLGTSVLDCWKRWDGEEETGGHRGVRAWGTAMGWEPVPSLGSGLESPGTGVVITLQHMARVHVCDSLPICAQCSDAYEFTTQESTMTRGKADLRAPPWPSPFQVCDARGTWPPIDCLPSHIATAQSRYSRNAQQSSAPN